MGRRIVQSKAGANIALQEKLVLKETLAASTAAEQTHKLLQEACDDLRSSIADLGYEKDLKEKELAAQLDALGKAKAALQHTVAATAAHEGAHTTIIKTLQQQREETASAARVAAQTASDEQTQHSTALEELKHAVVAKNKELVDVSGKLATTREDLQEIEDKVLRATNELRAVAEKTTAASTELVEINKRIAEAQETHNTATTIQQNVALDLDKKVQSLKDDISAHKTATEQLMKKKEDAQKEVDGKVETMASLGRREEACRLESVRLEKLAKRLGVPSNL